MPPSKFSGANAVFCSDSLVFNARRKSSDMKYLPFIEQLEVLFWPGKGMVRGEGDKKYKMTLRK